MGWVQRWCTGAALAMLAACPGLACLAMLAACPGSTTTRPAAVETDPCDAARQHLADAAARAADGYLGRALDDIDRAVALCTGDDTRDARDAALVRLWIDPTSVASHRREVSDDDRAAARLLYRAGQALRERDHDLDAAVARFTESFARWPNPLTLVQVGLTHAAAGRDVDAREAYARALAVARATRDAAAVPMPQTGHFGAITTIAYHPSRPIAASGSTDGTIIIWDLTSGRPLTTLTGHADRVSAVAFSPDGMTLASSSFDATVRLWDPPSGENTTAVTTISCPFSTAIAAPVAAFHSTMAL